MAYTDKADGVWVDKAAAGGTDVTNLVGADDTNRWEANQLDAHTRLTALETATVAFNAQTGTSYTAILSDLGKIVRMNNASTNTFTMPPNSSVAFPVAGYLDVLQTGAGQTSLSPGSGVTFRSRFGGTGLKIAGQYAAVTFTQLSANEWLVSGEVTL